MFRPLLKYAAPLVLLFALLFLTGVAQASVAFSETAAADHCCNKEAGQQPPTTEGECADPGCICPFCSVSILDSSLLLIATADELPTSLWALTSGPTSGYIRSIDYPPEST